MVVESIKKAKVIPLVQADDPEVAVKTSAALEAGGLNVIEVVLRTDNAFSCLQKIAEERTDALVGAGTVLGIDHAKRSVDNGAKFIVSPGLNAALVEWCMKENMPIIPGVATPSELQTAWNLGLRAVKLFPASVVGGIPMLKALSSVFRDVVFMPTGGVSEANLADFLSVPNVIACGGSWLTPAAKIDHGDFAAITDLAQRATGIAQSA